MGEIISMRIFLLLTSVELIATLFYGFVGIDMELGISSVKSLFCGAQIANLLLKSLPFTYRDQEIYTATVIAALTLLLLYSNFYVSSKPINSTTIDLYLTISLSSLLSSYFLNITAESYVSSFLYLFCAKMVEATIITAICCMQWEKDEGRLAGLIIYASTVPIGLCLCYILHDYNQNAVFVMTRKVLHGVYYGLQFFNILVTIHRDEEGDADKRSNGMIWIIVGFAYITLMVLLPAFITLKPVVDT